MALVREAGNRIKIENKSGRVSQVPIDPTETIWQGDLMKYTAGTPYRVTKMTASADGANFVGMSDHSNPQTSAGILTADFTKPYINVVQSGLVSIIAGAAETLRPFDSLEMVTDAQHVRKTATAANVVGIVDPGWAGTGKTVAIGDEIKMWLKVSDAYQVWSGRAV